MKDKLLVLSVFWTFAVLLYTVNVADQVGFIHLGKVTIGFNMDYKAIAMRYSILVPWLCYALYLWKTKK
jgi:hypothetical protein